MDFDKLLTFDEAKNGCARNPLDTPREIGCFSVDAEGCLRYNRSQMKYYFPRDDENLNLDLDVHYGRDLSEPYNRFKIMSYLLRWIENSRFEPLYEYCTDFVCTRGTIITLLISPYLPEPWQICACILENIIYMNVIDLQSSVEEYFRASEYERHCFAWGFKFEQYMTTNSPHGIPDLTSKTHEIEKFYIVVKNQIGSFNLLMQAEVDAINPSSSHPGNGDPSCYMELKTSILVPNILSTWSFQRSKSLEWWAQSKCAGIEDLVCGMRDKEGIVRRIQTFTTSDLPLLCENNWSDRICINFCHNILDYLKRKIIVNDPRIVYKLEFNGTKVSFSRVKDPKGPWKVLPDWYIARLQKNNQLWSNLQKNKLKRDTPREE